MDLLPAFPSARRAFSGLGLIATLTAFLAVSLSATAATLIHKRSSWRYLDDGSDQGTAWRHISYDDDAWGFGRGELGYGDDLDGRPETTVISGGPDPNNRYVTSYFRKVFYAEDPEFMNSLIIRLLRDDGGVVYLNGQEVFRSGMLDGPINYDTWASPGTSGIDETIYNEGSISPAFLVNGLNLIAVEIHQHLPYSSDLSFDLELVADEVITPPSVSITRGPYLQSGTTSNIVVRWRTDADAASEVRFGLSPGALNWSASSVTPTSEHSITLTNLAPNRRYFYEITDGASVLAGGPGHDFVTAPATPKPTRIWAIGDSGTASAFAPGAAQVANSYRAYPGANETDVWMMLGDNAYYSGTDAEYQIAVFETYPDFLRRFPLWSTFGNHDAASPAVYKNIFSLPTDGRAGGVASGTEHYYSFDYSDIHFVCLDSELSSNQPGSHMRTWLEADLAANTKTWTIAFWHSPPYNFGTHNSDSLADTAGHLVHMRERIVPVLESYGIDLVLCGHSHTYERSFLLHGHHGYSPSLQPQMLKDSGSGRPEDTGAYRKETADPDSSSGAVYVVAGSSGWVTGDLALPSYLHPAMFIKLKQLGSMVIDVDGPRLDAKFLRETGVIQDHFTILKGGPAEPVRLATLRHQGGNVAAKWKSKAGKSYRLEPTANLDAPSWTAISPAILATGATTSWTGPAGLPADKSFFRVRQLD